MYWLGCYYYHGMHSKENTDPDYEQAYVWWAKASDLGCVESRHNQARTSVYMHVYMYIL